MSTTTATDATAIRLSCNHTLTEWDGEAKEGAKVPCPKCPAKRLGGQPARRVKMVVRDEAPVAAPVAEWAPVATDTGADHGPIVPEAVRQAVQFPILAAAEAAIAAPPVDRVTAAMAAREEHAALRTWNEAGRVGDRPATPHLDALNEANAPGATKTARRAKSTGERKPRNADPLRLAANAARKDKGTGGRHNLRRVSDGELLTYIRLAKEYSPTSRSVDVRDYALWCDEVSVSYARWDRAWVDADDPTIADGDGGRDDA